MQLRRHKRIWPWVYTLLVLSLCRRVRVKHPSGWCHLCRFRVYMLPMYVNKFVVDRGGHEIDIKIQLIVSYRWSLLCRVYKDSWAKSYVFSWHLQLNAKPSKCHVRVCTWANESMPCVATCGHMYVMRSAHACANHVKRPITWSWAAANVSQYTVVKHS